MTPSNAQYLADNRHQYETFLQAGYLNLVNGEKDQFLRIMREEWQPGYHTSLWCGKCVVEMVKLVYRLYDEELKKEATA